MMEIETKRASLDTMAVTIQALHVDGKQMTLAVFRQLPVRDLIGRGGAFSGVPWGRVNYLAEGCHAHVVAQDGDSLFRSRVYLKPDDDYYRDYSMELEVELAKDAIVLIAAELANASGDVPNTITAGDLVFNTGWATGVREIYLSSGRSDGVEYRRFHVLRSNPWPTDLGDPASWLSEHGRGVIDYEAQKKVLLTAHRERLAEIDALPQLFIAV